MASGDLVRSEIDSATRVIRASKPDDLFLMLIDVHRHLARRADRTVGHLLFQPFDELPVAKQTKKTTLAIAGATVSVDGVRTATRAGVPSG